MHLLPSRHLEVEEVDQSLRKKDLRHLSIDFVYVLMCGKSCGSKLLKYLSNGERDKVKLRTFCLSFVLMLLKFLFRNGTKSQNVGRLFFDQRC
jgi:hypothetical protein